MLRRPFTEEPTSRPAVWSAKLGWFALIVGILSILIVRSGALEVEPALATFGAALGLAGLAILFAMAAFVSIWRQGRTELGRAVLGFFLGLALLCYPAYLGYRAFKLPAIYDITTDAANPPRFAALAQSRPPAMDAYRSSFAAKQRAAYPNIGALQYSMPPKPVFDAALNVVTKRKWRIAEADPPAPGRRDAVIEAVAHSLVMGFPDDVVIRVTPTGTGTRLDVRSAARYAWPDFGSNAARVQALLDDIDEAVGAPPAQGAPAEPKPAPAPVKRQPPARR